MDRSTDWILIAVSLFLAILLSAISVPEVILWGSPEWVALVVFYCVITMPEKMGFTFAFILGLVLDTLQGTPVMGTHSLGLALIVWAGLMMGKRFFLMKMVQQIFVLFLLLSVYLMIIHFIKSSVLVVNTGMNFLVPAIISSLLWPLVMMALNLFRHKTLN